MAGELGSPAGGVPAGPRTPLHGDARRGGRDRGGGRRRAAARARPGRGHRLDQPARADERRDARYAAGAVLAWRAWWDQAGANPILAPLVEERQRIYAQPHGPEWTPAASWHLDALRAAGFSETGLVWRGGADAAVAAIR